VKQNIQAWETQDGNLIVVGTHDPHQARVAVLAYCQENNYAADSEEFKDCWSAVNDREFAMRWVPKNQVNAESWTQAKSYHWGKKHDVTDYLPYLFWF
jgi:hypothetical protein